jgi:hypothetical protein
MIAVARFCAAAVMPVLAACTDSTEPPGPPYLAIVTNLYALGGASAPTEIVYDVRDFRELAGYKKRFRVSPADTVILSLPPAGYQVSVEGLPSRCTVSNGPARSIVLTDEDNTGIIRYSIQCLGVVSVGVVADGPMLDSGFVYRFRHADGTEYTGLVGANDTATVDDAGPGEYEVQLGGVAANCVIVSTGGAIQRVTATSHGGAMVNFRVTCSDLAHRPQLLSLAGGYDGGASIFTFRVWDPDHDIDGYVWDLTDCQGTSILPDKRERTRRNLLSGRAQASDTVVIVGAYEVGLPASTVAGRCTEIRVFDEHGNSSVVLQHRIGGTPGIPRGFAPTVRFFNATLQGTSSVTSLLAASDPENDIVGHFVLVRLRDGVLGQSDGFPDLGSMDPAGYLTLDVPAIPTTGRIRWDDVLAVIAYVVDAKGNAIRVEDADIFR